MKIWFRRTKSITLNPFEEDSITIHLVPPKADSEISSLTIVNGKEIVPLNPMWAVIFAIFIDQINYFGYEIKENNLYDAVSRTITYASLIYRKTDKEVLREDLKEILDTIIKVSKGEAKIAPIAIGKYAKYMAHPHRMDLMVTSMRTSEGKWHCNQKCINCYASGQCEAEKTQLSTDDWKQIIRKCKDIGIPQLTFTGGEPLLRSDIVALVREAEWFTTRLNTNGVKLDPIMCRDLFEAGLDAIQITLYSSVLQKHEALIGNTNGFEKTVDGIKFALKAGLNVTVNTPLCRINSNYVDTVKFLYKLGVRSVSCSGIIFTGNAKGTVKIQMERDELFECVREAVEFARSHDMEINFTSPGLLKREELELLGLEIPVCGACMSNMAIAPNGDVVPCQSWLDRRHCLGNMLVNSWREIWDSSLCSGIRRDTSEMREMCPLRLSNDIDFKSNKETHIVNQSYSCSCAAGGGKAHSTSKDYHKTNLKTEMLVKFFNL